jgi:anti-anti-sigma factor
MKNFSFMIKEFDNFIIFYFDGYLNNRFRELEIEDKLDILLKKGYNKFIMNFYKIKLINSVGISILIGIVDKIIKNKGKLAFSNLSKTTLEIFEIVGLTKDIKMFKKEKEAIRYILE